MIPLSLELGKLPKALKSGQKVPVVGNELVRWHYADQGIDLLATDRVQAIFRMRSRAKP